MSETMDKQKSADATPAQALITKWRELQHSHARRADQLPRGFQQTQMAAASDVYAQCADELEAALAVDEKSTKTRENAE